MEAAAGANAKHYQWRSEGGVFRMSLLNDSDVTFAQQNILVANPSGYVGIGTASPAANNATGAITGATINATYQDVAEWVPSTQKLSAGTVVVLDTNRTN